MVSKKSNEHVKFFNWLHSFPQGYIYLVNFVSHNAVYASWWRALATIKLAQ